MKQINTHKKDNLQEISVNKIKSKFDPKKKALSKLVFGKGLRSLSIDGVAQFTTNAVTTKDVSYWQQTICMLDWFDAIAMTDLSYTERANLAVFGDLLVRCDCPSFLFHGFSYALSHLDKIGLSDPKGSANAINYPDYDMNVGGEEDRYPIVRNPELKGIVCKHLITILETWPFKVSSVAKSMKEYVESGKITIAETEKGNIAYVTEDGPPPGIKLKPAKKASEESTEDEEEEKGTETPEEEEKSTEEAPTDSEEGNEEESEKKESRSRALQESKDYSKFPLSSLVTIAKKCPTFEEFERVYSKDINHGYAWHLTDKENFSISSEISPRDMSSMGGGGSDVPGAIMITTHLEYWDEYYNKGEYKNTRPYAVLFDVSEIEPKYFKQVTRGFGNEIFLYPEQASQLKQLGVYPIKTARRKERGLSAQVPSSREALLNLWNFAHEIKNIELELMCANGDYLGVKEASKLLKKYKRELENRGIEVDIIHSGATQIKASLQRTLPESIRDMDEEYMEAAKSGNLEVCQDLVDTAAQSSPYQIGPVYHGGIFNPKKHSKFIGGFYGAIFFSSTLEGAEHFGSAGDESYEKDKDYHITKTYLSGNIFDVDNPEHIDKVRDWAKENQVDINDLENGYYMEWENPKLLDYIKSIGFEGFTTYEHDKNYAIFNPSQVKIADPITYDNHGYIIPLSQRFNPDTSDVRESKLTEMAELVKSQDKNVQESLETREQVFAYLTEMRKINEA